MKLNKFLSLTLVSLLALSALTGCAQTETSSPAESSAVSSEASAEPSEESKAEEAAPLSFTDHAGRTVTLEKPAEKVVSVYYLSTSLLAAIGAEDKLVGIEMKAETRPLYAEAFPELLELPAVGSGKGVNVEETAALEPDLVVLPLKLKDSVEQFEALNIPVAVIDPETMPTFLETVEMLGLATGCAEKAGQLVSYYNEVMEDVSARTANLEDKPTVYIAGSDMLRTAGSGMYQNDLIEMAGGVNAAASMDSAQWADITAEELVSWDPDKIFLVSYSDYTRDEFLADERFASLSAVQDADNSVVIFPGEIEAWDYPTASSVLDILWLANQLHPDVVTAEEAETAASEFYETYFGIEYTAE